jgi:hypothetical protein
MTPEDHLASREQVLRERDTFMAAYNKAQDQLQAFRDERDWDKRAAQVAERGIQTIVRSLDQVRAAVDKLTARLDAFMDHWGAAAKRLDALRIVDMAAEQITAKRKRKPKKAVK